MRSTTASGGVLLPDTCEFRLKSVWRVTPGLGNPEAPWKSPLRVQPVPSYLQARAESAFAVGGGTLETKRHCNTERINE